MKHHHQITWTPSPDGLTSLEHHHQTVGHWTLISHGTPSPDNIDTITRRSDINGTRAPDSETWDSNITWPHMVHHHQMTWTTSPDGLTSMEHHHQTVGHGTVTSHGLTWNTITRWYGHHHQTVWQGTPPPDGLQRDTGGAFSWKPHVPPKAPRRVEWVNEDSSVTFLSLFVRRKKERKKKTAEKKCLGKFGGIVFSW